MKSKHVAAEVALLICLAMLHCCRGFSYLHISTSHHLSRQQHLVTKTLMQQSISSSTEPTNEKKTVRILCLHGKGGNGNIFAESALRPLISLIYTRLEETNAGQRISFEMDAITAPFEIPSGKNTNDDNKGFSWWNMPAGVRSFNAKEYEGFGESEAMVMDSLYSEERCDYDIILGHSQGAILTAALIAVHNKLWMSTSSPKGFIFNGVAWPNPYGNNIQALSELTQQEQTNLPRMLFIMGKADDINPIESAKRVSGAFDDAGFDVSIVEHNGGHSVPDNNDDDSEQALSQVVDWIMNIAEQK